MNISKFTQDENDIPAPIKSDVMHPDIYYYYRHLHQLMNQQGLIDDGTGVCLYPGIGPDITTVDTLLGKRKIVGFDIAGLGRENAKKSINWYNVEELNRCLNVMKNPDKSFSVSDYFYMNYTPSRKRKNGGYLTKDLKGNANGFNLLGELFALGIAPKDIMCTGGNSFGTTYIKISFLNNVYPEIIIYQMDVLEKANEKKIQQIIDHYTPSYYLEKSGEGITAFDGMSIPSISLPLSLMMQKETTKAICLGGTGDAYNPDKQFNPLREKLQQKLSISHSSRIEKIKKLLLQELTRNTQENYGNYRRDMNVYRKK